MDCFNIQTNLFLFMIALNVVNVIGLNCGKRECRCLKCFEDEPQNFYPNASVIEWRLDYSFNKNALCLINKTRVEHKLYNGKMFLEDSQKIDFNSNVYFCDEQRGNLCFFRAEKLYPSKFKCELLSPHRQQNYFDMNLLAFGR